jgi:hypothetical protein
MGNVTSQDLFRKARCEANKSWCDWNQVFSGCSEIIVFGSRATGVHRKASDIDILCIGEGRRVKTRRLDLLWLPISALYTREWLGCELACHVAEFGVWLKGSGDWRSSVHISQQAIQLKEGRILRLARSVDHCWNRLHPGYQQRYQTTLRREIQRLMRLRSNITVPPTPVLDSQWGATSTSKDKVLEFVETSSSLGSLHSSSTLFRSTFENFGRVARPSPSFPFSYVSRH